MVKPTSAAVLAALALGACGGDERLTKQELSAELTPQIERVTAGFASVFQAIGEAGETERVPPAALEKARQAAETERSAASAIAALEPPDGAEGGVDRLVAAAREQAGEVEAVAGRSRVSVGELADAMEGGGTRDAIAGLAKGGYVTPPGD